MRPPSIMERSSNRFSLIRRSTTNTFTSQDTPTTPRTSPLPKMSVPPSLMTIPPLLPPAAQRLQNRVVIITGSSGRLGRAISCLFASHGAFVFLVDKYRLPRNPFNVATGKADDWESRIDMSRRNGHGKGMGMSDAEAEMYMPTDEFIGTRYRSKDDDDTSPKVYFHATDLCAEFAVKAMIAKCVEVYGRVDVLVNAHGVSVESTYPKPMALHELQLSDFNKTMNINTTSLFLTMKYFLSQVMKQDAVHEAGRAWIVNIASVQASQPYFGTASYCASKGAALMLTKQVALDYAPVGVRCNAVCPGFLDSEMTQNLKGDTYTLRDVAARHPLQTRGLETEGVIPANGPGKGGLGRVEDVAKMVLMLAGDDARWITGQGITVDGGYSIS